MDNILGILKALPKLKNFFGSLETRGRNNKQKYSTKSCLKKDNPKPAMQKMRRGFPFVNEFVLIGY